jgi:hypothetical protein
MVGRSFGLPFGYYFYHVIVTGLSLTGSTCLNESRGSDPTLSRSRACQSRPGRDGPAESAAARPGPGAGLLRGSRRRPTRSGGPLRRTRTRGLGPARRAGPGLRHPEAPSPSHGASVTVHWATGVTDSDARPRHSGLGVTVHRRSSARARRPGVRGTPAAVTVTVTCQVVGGRGTVGVLGLDSRLARRRTASRASEGPALPGIHRATDFFGLAAAGAGAVYDSDFKFRLRSWPGPASEDLAAN